MSTKRQEGKESGWGGVNIHCCGLGSVVGGACGCDSGAAEGTVTGATGARRQGLEVE